MKKLVLAIVLLFVHLSLTGCWNQRLLKDGRLVYASSFDLMEDNRILTTAIVRDFQGEFPTNVEIQDSGRTIRETRIKMDRKVSGTLEPSKNRVFIMGEDLAKKDIYQFLDILYRDPSSSISSKLVISEGMGADILSKLDQKNTLIAEFLLELIKSGEKSTEIDKYNLQSICTLMFDEGKDFILPLITLENGEVELEGSAMFHKHAMTGKISISDTTLFLLMTGKKAKVSRFVTKMDTENDTSLDDYVTYNVVKPKSKMKIISDDPSNIKVEIIMKAGISISEFPADKLAEAKTIKEINGKIQKDLSKRSKKLIQTLQTANSDVFGIGRELIAFHPDTWKKVDWEEEYPKITIIPKIETKVVGHGIIN
ncbi:Ger(x)C family spore germination protein [Rossellomorea aquimaris]|uniref:Ger(x)C family spore germination protein n=1 Tax=Rossellomorea aquimaris TaxID=189382 RepID=UPI001CD775A1|nr:Ger(x)C family spore germination protein [Rossellomorea aquimaris]MCA1054444.1 Ger(x)C family spore germination protein [Rossellomorea aquimaris]